MSWAPAGWTAGQYPIASVTEGLEDQPSYAAGHHC